MASILCKNQYAKKACSSGAPVAADAPVPPKRTLTEIITMKKDHHAALLLLFLKIRRMPYATSTVTGVRITSDTKEPMMIMKMMGLVNGAVA